MTCAKGKMRCLIGLGGSNVMPLLVMPLAFMAKEYIAVSFPNKSKCERAGAHPAE